MKKLLKSMTACALALVFCLSGCTGGSKQPKQASADSAEEALVNFLTNLQNGEFDQAKTYLNEENPLLNVFPVEEGQTAPELDAVYRQFREKMTGLKFRVADEGAVGNGMVYIAAEQYDFGPAINAAMLEAMQTQARKNYAKLSLVYASGAAENHTTFTQEDVQVAAEGIVDGTYQLVDLTYPEGYLWIRVTAGDKLDGRCTVEAARPGGPELEFYSAKMPPRQAAAWLTGYPHGQYMPGGREWKRVKK